MRFLSAAIKCLLNGISVRIGMPSFGTRKRLRELMIAPDPGKIQGRRIA
jgi:hypothetical protein